MTAHVRPVPHPAEAVQLADALYESALATFLTQRTQLLGIARRITGDRETAEDVLQEVWLRWQRTDRDQVRNSAAFLVTATSHAAINVIQSARSRHESVAPSPLTELASPSEDPSSRAEQVDAVSQGMELLMARLNGRERAAYLLRKAFDYPYRQVSQVLGIEVAHSRQLVRRAQHKLDHGTVRPFSLEAHRHLVEAFLLAADSGDLEPLERELERQVRKSPGRHLPAAAPVRRGPRRANSGHQVQRRAAAHPSRGRL